MGKKKPHKSEQGTLDFGGHTFASSSAAGTNGSKDKAPKGKQKADEVGQHAGSSKGKEKAPASPSPGKFVGVAIPPTPKSARSSPSKGKTGVSSATKQMTFDDFRPVASSSGANGIASPHRPSPHKANNTAPAIQLRFGPDDIGKLQKPTRAMLKAEAQARRRVQDSDEEDRERTQRQARLGSMELDLQGEELESGEDEVGLGRQSSSDGEMPQASPSKRLSVSKGKGKAPVVIESTEESSDSESDQPMPAPTNTSRQVIRGSTKRARNRISDSDSDDDEILSPKKPKAVPRSSTTPRAKQPPPKQAKRKPRKPSTPIDSDSSSDLPDALPPAKSKGKGKRPSRREPSVVDDHEEEDATEDVDDLELSDFEATKTRLREKKPDQAGQKFASLRKARQARAKREDRAKEVRATRIIPDTDSEEERERRKEVVSISSEEEDEDDEDEEEEEEESIENYIVDDAEDAETRRAVAQLMPQEFRGASRQTKVYHFMTCCQYFIHVILMPYLDWMKISEDFKYSTQQIKIHFESLADSLVASQAWKLKFTRALKNRPDLDTEMIEAEQGCEACNSQAKTSTLLLTFSGSGYDQYTMQERSAEEYDESSSSRSSDSDSDSEHSEERPWRDESFKCGRFCAERGRTFHELWHWKHEVYHSLKDEVDKKRDRSIPQPKPGKKPKQAITDRLRIDADRLTEATKGLVQQMWDDFRAREKAAKQAYVQGA